MILYTGYGTMSTLDPVITPRTRGCLGTRPKHAVTGFCYRTNRDQGNFGLMPAYSESVQRGGHVISHA